MAGGSLGPRGSSRRTAPTRGRRPSSTSPAPSRRPAAETSRVRRASPRSACEAARRHGSEQYAALSLHQQGLFLLAAGHTDEGLACLDEAMLGVASGACSAMVEGIIYCGVIEGCWSIYELTRAQQWTAAMTQWVAAQPDLGNFTGECKVRRAELKQFNGHWPEALDELDAVSFADRDQWAVGPGRQRAREPRPAARQVRLGRGVLRPRVEARRGPAAWARVAPSGPRERAGSGRHGPTLARGDPPDRPAHPGARRRDRDPARCRRDRCGRSHRRRAAGHRRP